MLTNLGKYLRKLRIDNGETLRTMAQTLGVSSAFLSAVENGKKKLPDSLINKLIEKYCLSEKQIDELKQAIVESGDTVELNIRNVTDENRRLAISFARKFENLDKEESAKILSILNNHKEK